MTKQQLFSDKLLARFMADTLKLEPTYKRDASKLKPPQRRVVEHLRKGGKLWAPWHTLKKRAFACEKDGKLSFFVFLSTLNTMEREGILDGYHQGDSVCWELTTGWRT